MYVGCGYRQSDLVAGEKHRVPEGDDAVPFTVSNCADSGK